VSVSVTVLPPEAAETRLLIFGLTPDVTVAEVQALLGRCRLAAVELLVQPVPAGQPEQTVGLVHLPPGRLLALQLSERINQRRLHGRRLLAWVPAMAWG
jgi:hypothetical protein